MQPLRLLPSPHPHRLLGLLPPEKELRSGVSAGTTKDTYKVSEEVKKVDEVIQHLWLLLPLLVCPEEQVIPSKSTRFMDMLECRVCGRGMYTGVSRSSRSTSLPSLIGLPLVNIVTQSSVNTSFSAV